MRLELTVPAELRDCLPVIRKATATQFELMNPSRPSNFIMGELVAGGELVFIVENLPKTNPPSGCSGRWMFGVMMNHFGAGVSVIQGNWVGPSSDNLIAVNRLTGRGTMTVEEAARRTWTGLRAIDYGFSRVRVIGHPSGTPGRYTSVVVVFER